MATIKIPLNGPAYKGPSNAINAQECVNYVHNIDQQGGKGGVLQLIGRPGLDLFSTIGAAAIRGMIKVDNLAYIVAGNKFYREDNTGGFGTAKGTLNTSTGYVGMAHNGTEIVIVDGTDGWSYLIATNNFAEITDAGFSGGNDVQFIDQYFVVDNLTGGTAQVSALNDGRTWSALDKATPEADPDGLLRVMCIHSTMWMMGEVTTEPWYNASLPSGFPFMRQTSGVLDMGLLARWACVKADNTLYWLARNKEGLYGIVKLAGLSVEKVSTPALDYEIRNYSTVLDCIAWTFTDAGHTFIGFTFPTAGKTWVFDSSTGMWAEWRSWGLTSFRCAFAMYYNERVILGDRTTGLLYEVNWDTFQDNGNFIEGIRTTQHIDSLGRDIEWNSVEVFAQTGVGPAEAADAEEPMAMLSFSDDRGYTFNDEQWRSLGWQGEYKKQLVWTRQGSSPDRVWRLRITADCRRVIMGAVAEVE